MKDSQIRTFRKKGPVAKISWLRRYFKISHVRAMSILRATKGASFESVSRILSSVETTVLRTNV